MRLRVVADIPESPLSDICQHPPPRLPIGRLKRSKIKKEKPNNGISPILSKGRKATISHISTTSKGKEHLLTALNTVRRDSLPLGGH